MRGHFAPTRKTFTNLNDGWDDEDGDDDDRDGDHVDSSNLLN